MFNKKINHQGFTLIELLVVIVIIGILATLATVGLNSVRAKARDSKRISDIRQMQSALELYFNDNNGYPTNGAFTVGAPLTSPDGTKTYMSKVPSNPKPWGEGACVSSSVEYGYNSNNTNTYQLSYCLANNVNDIAAGAAQALPGNINNACSKQCGAGKYCGDSDGCGGKCSAALPSGAASITGLTCSAGGNIVCGSTVISDYSKIDTCTAGTGVIACGGTSGGCVGAQVCSSGACAAPNPCTASTRTTECTAANNIGDFCGGGTVVCTSKGDAASLACGNINLVASPSGCTGGATCTCGNDSVTNQLRSPSLGTITPVPLSLSDGRDNFYDGAAGVGSKPAVLNLAEYTTSQFCSGMTVGGFNDWYLPAEYEICAISRSGNYCDTINSSGSACVAGASQSAAKSQLSGCTNSAPIVSGLRNSWYWMSSMFNSTTSREHNAGTGAVSHGGDVGPYYVRCVRRF